MTVRVLCGDTLSVLSSLPAQSVQTCVTSPPYYGLRSYLPDGHPDKHLEIGLESTPDEYIARLVHVFREVRRVLRDDGVCWINLGDSYASKPAGSNGFHDGRANRDERTSAGIPVGLKPKDLIGIPWRVAFALQADGWYLRSDVIWSKPNPMPESVRDRPTKAHEYVFLLSKSPRYFWDADAIREAPSGRTDAFGIMNTKDDGSREKRRHEMTGDIGANARTVWTIATQPYPGAHFATMPPELAERCIKAGSRPGDTILDPFGGAGTTGLVADRLQRHAVLIELNSGYADQARGRLTQDAPLFAEIA